MHAQQDEGIVALAGWCTASWSVDCLSRLHSCSFALSVLLPLIVCYLPAAARLSDGSVYTGIVQRLLWKNFFLGIWLSWCALCCYLRCTSNSLWSLVHRSGHAPASRGRSSKSLT